MRLRSYEWHTGNISIIPCPVLYHFVIRVNVSIELFLQNFFDKKNKTLDNWMFGRLCLSFCTEIGYGTSANGCSAFVFNFLQCESITKSFISEKVSCGIKSLSLVSKLMLALYIAEWILRIILSDLNLETDLIETCFGSNSEATVTSNTGTMQINKSLINWSSISNSI